MRNKRGGLIKKKKPTIMQPSVPVRKGKMDFSFNAPIKQEEPVVVTQSAPPDIEKEVMKIELYDN